MHCYSKNVGVMVCIYRYLLNWYIYKRHHGNQQFVLYKGGRESRIFKVNKPGIQADRILCLFKLQQAVSFGSLHPFTVRKIGHLPVGIDIQ